MLIWLHAAGRLAPLPLVSGWRGELCVPDTVLLLRVLAGSGCLVGGGVGRVLPPDPGRVGGTRELAFKVTPGCPSWPRFRDTCPADPEGAWMSQVRCQAFRI